VVYLTEDEEDGCFYRFTPSTWGDLCKSLRLSSAGHHPAGEAGR
jgi:hypothetical protein